MVVMTKKFFKEYLLFHFYSRFQESEGCLGIESSIDECKPRNLWVHDHHCEHEEDVAITCDTLSKDKLAPNEYESYQDYLKWLNLEREKKSVS